MKKHYNFTKWLSTRFTGLLMSAGLLMAGSSAMAQLSGTYTINSAAATTGTNFASFTAFASAINTSGVSGPVTVNVVSGSGPYYHTATTTFNQISGASATNTITINGNGEKVSSNAGAAVFTLYGTDYMTFKNLKVEASANAASVKCFHIYNAANYNTIDGCELIISAYTGTANSTGYIVMSASTTGNSAGLHGSHNTFKNNKMWNGGATGAVGPYYGVCEYGSSSYYTTTGNNQVLNNEVRDVYYYYNYFYYTNGTRIDGNKFHTSRSDASYTYVTYLYYTQTTTHQISFSSNEVYNLKPTSYLYMYGYYNTGTASMPVLYNDNKIHDNTVGSYLYNYLGYYGQNVRFERNKIYNNTVTNYLYNLYCCYYSTNAIVRDNELNNNYAGYYIYGLGAYYGTNALVERNAVHDNSAGYGVYGYYIYYMQGDFINNLYYNNKGDYYNYAMLAGYTQTTLHVAHNTFVLNNDVTYYSYGMYMYMYYSFTDVVCKNNILAITANSGSGYYNYVVYMPYNYQSMGIENNDFYVNNSSTNYYYTNTTNTTAAAFASSIGNTTNLNIDPQFTNLATGDLTPKNPAIANYGQPGYATLDYKKATRTACGPDIGAFEFYIDHNASNLVFTGTNECGGYQEPIGFRFNNGSTVALKNAKVYYTINGGTPVVETIANINANSYVDYVFKTIPEFHEPGINTIVVGLFCDDNSSNNTVTTTIKITPAPHSFELSEGTAFAGYYQAGGSGGTKKNPDVTAANVQVNYNVENPTKYANSAYGSGWSMSINAKTSGGTAVTSGVTLVSPTSSTKGKIQFKPAKSLVDSTVFLGITVKDNNTGCDSTFGRWVYVAATPELSWNAPNACDGDVIAFSNTTTQAVGIAEYSWNFDDPSTGADNVSTISDPVHKFSTYGSYDVTVTAWNHDYPKFQYTLTKTVNVSPVPTVDFTVKNACEGTDITFTNGSKLPTGVTGSIDYTWNFGDGSAKVKTLNTTHKYAKAGGYKASLTASLNGCAATLVKNANQFATPDANFSVKGNCNLEDVEFTNASTISLGKTGYKWDFNDGTVSNLSNPMHAFAAAGSHSVKLVAISEFGCKDEITKSFTLNESPKADFSFSDPCSETAVNFTRGGTLPAGATSIFEWDFDGEKISTKENDSYKFSTVGVKTVSLKVSSNNGCSDMISKDIVVKLQAKADFIANNVCEGEEVVFTNKSEVAAGNLNYEWRFGDSKTSNLTSPRHAYTLSTVGETESFQVTLLAIVPGGCSDSIARTVTVNAAADASFDAKIDWRVLKITNQKTTDPVNHVYNWRFGDGGRSNQVTPSYKYITDEGEYTVCLAIINPAGCISEHCEDVYQDPTTGINDVIANNLFSVYPNPNTGLFTVKVDEPKGMVNITIMDATGKTVCTIAGDASGEYSIDLSEVAGGVYMVQVTNGGNTAMQRVTVAK
ncbi:MAG: PKD domain-containing protein [Bacteroidia bacterium]